MNIWLFILIGWLVMAVAMTALWFVQRRTGNAGTVDIVWSLGTAAMACWFCFGATGDSTRRWLISIIVAVCGLRLGLHLALRIIGQEEDGRYQKLRENWGPRTQRNMFIFFQIQAAWTILFALPMLAAAMNDTPGLRWFDGMGVAIWLISIVGESIADRQLEKFRSNPANRGKVCRMGLWNYSRHPNYFFEWLHWWAYPLIGIGSSWWLVTILGPLVMLFFLLNVTGIPMTEARAIASRGQAYRDYQRTTSKFSPWPPRKSEATS
jgi:steroid 5-alpha reductase family enzyme